MKVLGVCSPVLVFGRRDDRIAKIASLQRGRISRAQLRMAGISDPTTDRLKARGKLRPLHRCVFAVGHDAPIELGDETAALLAVCDGAALSHATAAVLWGMRRPPSEGLIHVVAARGTGKPSGVRVHRARILAPVDVRICRGLPVTSPARTLLDWGDALSERELELAFDQALIARIIRPQDVHEIIGRAPGRAGATRLRNLLRRQHGPKLTRSQAEELFLALIRQAGLPEPEMNVRVHGFEVDFFWREQGVVVEIDGFRFHSGRRSFEYDRRKDATLQAAGLLTMRVTWIQMQNEAYAVIARLATTLA
ncbi:MAG: DUF559 domain-containing protein, partial [Solirubrobacteraceae bacterium]